MSIGLRPPRIWLHRIASSTSSSSFSSHRLANGSSRQRSSAFVVAPRKYFASSPVYTHNSSTTNVPHERDASASGFIPRQGSVGASTSANGSAENGKAISNQDDRSTRSVFEEEIKSIVQHIPYAIVVLTTGAENDIDTWRGMTLSSFTTLSMRPTPLATINIKTPSHTLTQLLQSRRCVINVLLRNKDGIKCAGTFANPNSPLAAQRDQFSQDGESSGGDSGGSRVYYGPALREEAVYFSLDCSIHDTLLVQDHTLVVLEIVKANRNRRLESLRDYEALFYKRRDYDLLSEGTRTPFVSE